MTSLNRSAVLPTLALITVTAVWGSTFFLLKDLVKQMPPLDFLGARFALAGLLVAVFQFNRIRSAGVREWKRGFVLGALYSAGQLLQTIGLQYTDASISGFITGMYVVFTPILVAVLFKKRLSMKVWLAVAMATIGLAFLSIQGGVGGFNLGVGEAVTLAGAFFYALHIVFLGRWAHQSEPLTLGMIQIISAGTILGIAAIPGGISLPQTPGAWSSFLYMTIVAGLGAIILQTWAQSRIEATTAAVIMTTEPVFAAGFAIAFGGESLTVRLLLGGALVLAAMFLVETGGGDGGDDGGGGDHNSESSDDYAGEPLGSASDAPQGPPQWPSPQAPPKGPSPHAPPKPQLGGKMTTESV